MSESFNHIEKVKGEFYLPGDKSISHRAVIFSAMAEGDSIIKNLPESLDVKSTIDCFKDLGVHFKQEDNSLIVNGVGYKGFNKPLNELNCGNSGTTARLLSGILAMQNFESILTGDKYLLNRPMKRIITPLSAMGAKINASENFTLPLNIYPSEKLNNILYEPPIPSAQIKSSILLAGLHLEEETAVVEEIPSRDHTERMLNLQSDFKDGKKIIYSSKEYYPEPNEYFIPGDISNAAFFIILSLLTNKSELIIKNVSLNETRTGYINILKKMGGKIQTEEKFISNGEPCGNILVKDSKLSNISIDENLIPNIIDEIPILSVAGIFAEGKFEIRNAKELRVKETDRINALCVNYAQLGLDVEEFDDGFSVSGEIKNETPFFESFGDHRIAMTFAVLSLLLKQGGKVNNFTCVNISNPDFLNQLKNIIG